MRMIVVRGGAGLFHGERVRRRRRIGSGKPSDWGVNTKAFPSRL